MLYSPLQWERINNLFHEALGKDPRFQEEFVRRACRGDEVVQAGVRRLLSSHGVVGEMFEPPAELIASAESRLADRRIGAYRLVRSIASGGMGNVWLAERADDQFRQSVAIKLVNTGVLTEEMRKSFRREQQTLAQLEHPYITRLIDGGTSDEGWPYLVMEYVDGKPIDVFCDENRLCISDRLALFRKVCEAVQHAHQRLIVHRDLKPNNIIVARDGRPKLLDFGISKLLKTPGDEMAPEMTRTLVRVMTPQYASPEQLQGNSITTATDVYSLGVILYELLSGHRPHMWSGHSDSQWEQIVCNSDPIAPSLVVERMDGLAMRVHTEEAATPQLVCEFRRECLSVLRRRLRGDLDNIVLTAMQLDPRRRYTSASEFSEDVRRHLKRLPVAARRDTVTYRIAKFVRRNNKIVIAGAMMLATLIAGLAGTTIAMQRARDDRDTAVKLTEFLEDVFFLGTPFRNGRNRATVGFLQAAAARIETELDDEPAVKARAYMAMARTYQRMWQWRDVATFAQKALTANRVLYGDKHPAVADSLIIVGRALALEKDVHAVELLHEAIDTNLDLYGHEDARTASAIGALAVASWRVTVPRDWNKAEALFREAIAIYRHCPHTDPHALAVALGDFAVMSLARRDLSDEAESLFLEAERLFDAGSGEMSRTAAEYKRSYAGFLFFSGRYEEQANELREYLDMTPRMFDFHNRLHHSRWRLAEVELGLGNSEAAERCYRDALAAACDGRMWYHPELEDGLSALSAKIVLSRGTDQLAKLAVELLEFVCEKNHAGNPQLGRRLADLAVAACQDGYEDAGRTLLHALEERQRAFCPNDELCNVYFCNAAGACSLAGGRFDEAKELLVKSSKLLRYSAIDNRLMVFRRMIDLYEATGEPNKAARYETMISNLRPRKRR